MGHDPGAGFELARELRPQPRIHLRREEECAHCGGLDLGIEDVLDAERHAVGDPGPDCVDLRFPNALRIEVHAYPARPELLGGRDEDAAVAAPEVIDDVIARDVGEGEHGVHYLKVGRDEDYVELDGGWELAARHPGAPLRHSRTARRSA